MQYWMQLCSKLSLHGHLQAITNLEIDDSIDRIVAGMEGKPLVDGKAKSLVAYHEVCVFEGLGACALPSKFSIKE